MKPRTRMTAIASALFLAQATWALAQTTPGGPGTGPGAATPTQPGIAPGATTLGVTPAPTAPPRQAPSPGTVQSTPPPTTKGPAAHSSSGTVGRSGRVTRLDDPKDDPAVQETEREVSRRIKSICKGC